MLNYQTFNDIIEQARVKGKKIISVAAANEYSLIKALYEAQQLNMVQSILVGDKELIYPLVKNIGLKEYEIIHETEPSQAALKAVSFVSSGQADILMKGLINSSDFLKAILDKEIGLKRNRRLSHLACLEIEGHDKLIFLTDSGLNLAPDLATKQEILTNALITLNNINIQAPKVALLSHNEKFNPKSSSSSDAIELMKLYRQGVFPLSVMEGPIAMDVALNSKAAKQKSIQSNISGQVDLFLVPNIEAGNILVKALVYFVKAKFAGLVIGASHPIVLASRADSSEAQLASLAFACLNA